MHEQSFNQPIIEAIAPVVEAVDEPRSEEFITALDIIQKGIEKSTKGGYVDIKVEYWVTDGADLSHDQFVRMDLAQFVGGNSLSKMVSKKEFDELKDIALEALIPSQDTAHEIGKTAVSGQAPVYLSGHETYRDMKSASANDPLD